MRGEFLLGLSKANREAAGLRAGDEVTLELELDSAPREVERSRCCAPARPGADSVPDAVAA
jgi:hypothetical protein